MQSQQLSLQKKKTFENFLTDKLSKRSPGYQDKVNRTLRWLDDYTIKTHQKSRDDIIDYLRTIRDIDAREDELNGWIQGFIDQLGDGKISFRVLQVYLSHIKKYLKYYRIRVDFGDEIELPPQLMEERYAIPFEDIQKIIENSPWKYKGYFLSLVSSGARPIEIMALRKKDFTWTGKLWRALIPAKYTKKKMSRTAFFSVEVTPYLNKILSEINDEDRVWCKRPDTPDDKIVHSRINAAKMFRKQCDKLGFVQRYETTNFFKHNMYCFRANFFTKALKSLSEDKDTAHAMIGHGAYLTNYQRRNDEEKEELYEEVMPAIMVYDQTINKEKIKKLKEANEQIEEKELRIDSLEAQLDALSKEKKSTSIIADNNTTKMVMEILKKQKLV